MKKIIYTKKAPDPVGPYSQAIFVNSTLYISGQVAINPETGKIENSNIENETLQVMKNLDFSGPSASSMLLEKMKQDAVMKAGGGIMSINEMIKPIGK